MAENASPTIVTIGHGQIDRRADRTELHVTYRARGADRKAAVGALTGRIAQVEPLLERPGLEIRNRSLRVGDHWDGRRRSGAESTQSYLLRIVDLDIVDEVVAALVDAEPESLDGPFWQLHDDASAVKEAQALAVADARRRADGYADALGARLGRLRSLVEQDSPVPMRAALRKSAPGFDIGELNLDPEQITVTARCTATWELRD